MNIKIAVVFIKMISILLDYYMRLGCYDKGTIKPARLHQITIDI